MRADSRTKHWTPEDDERFRSMIVVGPRPPEIAIKLQRSVSALYARAHILRLSFKRLRPRPR
jgi:hypothetical protein